MATRKSLDSWDKLMQFPGWETVEPLTMADIMDRMIDEMSENMVKDPSMITCTMVNASTATRYLGLFPESGVARHPRYMFQDEPGRDDISLDSFVLTKELGDGRYGRTRLGYPVKDPNFVVAIKTISNDHCVCTNVQKQIMQEIDNLTTMQCSHYVIKLYDWFRDKDGDVHIVMEYGIGGNILDLIQNRGRLSERDTARIMKHCIKAVMRCDKENVLHRDIKPENFVIGADGNIKLIDFGWSTHTCMGRWDKILCGTLDYVSPEMLEQRDYDQRIDIWGLGVMAFEMLTGEAPFMDNDRAVTRERIRKVDYNFPVYMGYSAKSFIKGILKHNRSKRYTCEELLAHPFITQNCNDTNALLFDLYANHECMKSRSF